VRQQVSPQNDHPHFAVGGCSEESVVEVAISMQIGSEEDFHRAMHLPKPPKSGSAR